MAAFEFNGKGYDLPGSYGELFVTGNSGANIPDFQVGLIIARSIKGRPYNTPEREASILMPLYDNDKDLLRDYGDDNIVKAYREASKTGAEAVFVMNASANTKTWFYLKNSTNNVLKLTAKDHWAGICANDITRTITEGASTQLHGGAGAMTGSATSATGTTLVNSGADWIVDALIGRWIRITGGTGAGQVRKITDNDATSVTVAAWTDNPDVTSTYQIVEALWTLTFIVPSTTKRLIQSSGTTDTIYVNSHNGLSAGMDVYLTSNGYAAPALKTIKSIDILRDTTKGGFRITFTEAIAVSALLTDYARIFQKDDNKEVITWTGDYSIQSVADELNANSQYFDTEVVSGAVLLPAAVAEAYVQNISAGSDGSMTGTATAGNTTTITDSGAGWTINALIGKYVRITAGAGLNQIRKIISNTATVLTVAALVVDADAGSEYLIIDAPGTNPYDTSASKQEGASLAAYSEIASEFKEWMKDFVFVNKIKVRNVYIDSYETAVHEIFRDLGTAMRTAASPIIVVAGTAWGDKNLDSTTSTNPTVRAKALNSDNFILCPGGIDRWPASLNYAAQVFGIKLRHGAFHNMTRDEIVYNSLEVNWSDTQAKQLIKAGCCIFDRYKKGILVVRGVNTYQYQDKIWNVQDRKTYLQMPRDLADKFFRGLIEGLDDELVGLDEATREYTETYCFKTGNNFLASREIQSFEILSIKKGKAGFLPSVQVEVADPTDFFGTKVFVIQPSVDV